MTRDARRTAAPPGWLARLRALGDTIAAELALLRADFVFVYRPGAPLRARGRVPAAKVRTISAFLANDLRPPGPVTIRGTGGRGRGRGRGLRVRITGPLSAGQCQALRNVLVDVLGSM